MIALAVGVAFVGCSEDRGDGDDGANATPASSPRTLTADTPISGTTPGRTPNAQPTAAASPVDGASEVQGIVGSVDVDEGVIIINPISGADVDRVAVTSDTQIRDTQGRELRLTQIRPSDRLVARGEVDGDELVADEVTIGQVVPGTSPG